MNILLVSPKEDKAQYESAIKSVSNANHLSTVSVVTEHFIDEIKERYNPHIIVWVCGVKMANNQSDLNTIKQIKDTYPYIRFIYFTNTEKSYDEVAKPLNELGIYTIVDRSITNIEFGELLKSPMKSSDEVIRFNKVKHRPVSVRMQRKQNNFIIENIRMFIPLIILVIVIIALFVYKGVNNISLDDGTATEPLTEPVTESVSEPTTEVVTLYASPTEKETEKSTEKTTERETEKPTEKQTERTTEKTTEKDENSSTTVNNNSGGTSHQEQPVQYEQPVQQSTPQVQQPAQQEPQQSTPQVQQPVQEPQPVVDDGLIHFDKDSYTVSEGETFDIYVTGLVASSGCKWTLTNSAVAEFVFSDATKVTVKAKAKGSTVITGTAKSNGATCQVLVTVQ